MLSDWLGIGPGEIATLKNEGVLWSAILSAEVLRQEGLDGWPRVD